MVSFSAGGSTLIAWKRRSRERSFSMYLRVLSGRRGADAADLAARQCGLQDIRRIERALGRSRADQRVQLVDEHDDVRVLGELLHDRLQALLELAAVLRPRDDERDVQGEDALVGQEVRHVAEHDLLRKTFDNRRLADAGFADQDRVVLGPPAEHLLDALEFVVSADERIQLVLHRRFGQVAAELGEQRRLLDARQRGLLVEELDDVLAHRVQPHPLFHEDRRRHGPLLTENTEKEVLSPDVVVQQPIGLLGRKLQHVLRLGAERNFDGRGHLLAKDRPAFDLLSDVLEGEVRPRENATGEPFAFADQPEKKVLGFNGYAAELAGLIAREEEDPSRPFCVAFEHRPA